MEKTRLPAAVQERSLYQWTGRKRPAEIEPKNGVRTFLLLILQLKRESLIYTPKWDVKYPDNLFILEFPTPGNFVVLSYGVT